MEDYKALYYDLLREHDYLKRELQSAQKLVGLIPANIQDVEVKSLYRSKPDLKPVSHYSVQKEKLDLFMDVFHGRRDVYARRYFSKREQKAGYAPVCGNRGDKNLCDFKCRGCLHRSDAPLAYDAVQKHLLGESPLGEDVIGIYPLLKGDECRFLAVDFDKENWLLDVKAFRKTCQSIGLPVYIERSRSGNGAHAWFFFSEPIKAAVARKLGNVLLTKTMNSHYQLKMESYDRLLPNQDLMPKAGKGNLIALPLQGAAMREGNSVFVDEDFNPFPDQWAVLASIQKLTANQVQVFADRLSYDELGELAGQAAPWEIPPKIKEIIPFPQKVRIVSANMLYVEKAGMSAMALNRIKRLAAFANPEFYKKQAARISTFNVPRVVDCSQDFKDYLAIPRGCRETLVKLLEAHQAQFLFLEKTYAGKPLPVAFNGHLQDGQRKAANEMLRHTTGVLSAATGFGKTVLATYLISKIQMNTLILVHTTALLGQWQAAVSKFLVSQHGSEKGFLGQLGAGKKALSGQIDVAIFNSVGKSEDLKTLMRGYGMVIVDECHHVAASTFEAVIREATAKYVYGLSATPKRQDGMSPIIFMQLGPIRYQTDAKKHLMSRGFGHFMIPKFTSFKMPAYLEGEEPRIQDIYGALVENEARNRRIVEDVKAAIEKGRNPIVLTQRKEHVKILAEALGKLADVVIELTGDKTPKQKQGQMDRLYGIGEKESLVVVATGQYIGEGFDYPRLDTMFLAMPFSWEGTLSQYTGRLHREYQGKEFVQVFDYVDVNVAMLDKMYRKRAKAYLELGYIVQNDGQAEEKAGMLFDHKTFLMPLKADFSGSLREIVIVSPFLLTGRVKSVIAMMAPLIERQVKVKLITRPATDYHKKQEVIIGLLDNLQNTGIQVIQKSAIHQKIIVIDRETVWYGSLNLLSYGRDAEETMMRFANREIALELLESLD
ncbi:MAG: DEAD/DEAH box helicase family protein [Turicibacter sp.]|nr:DEAD/DEAH box helicase family protein [Turicibacter sp.]